GNLLWTPSKSSKLTSSTFSHGVPELRILVIGEIEKGRTRRPFLTLKQHWNERCGQQHSCRYFQAICIHQMTTTFALCAIPDLIVVLRKCHKLMSRKAARTSSVMSVTKFRIAPIIDPGVLQSLRERGHRAEILIVASSLAGQNGVQCVMEIIIP